VNSSWNPDLSYVVDAQRLPGDDHLTSVLKSKTSSVIHRCVNHLWSSVISLWQWKPSLQQWKCDITPTIKTIGAAVWYHSDNEICLCTSVILLRQWQPSLQQCYITPTMKTVRAAMWHHWQTIIASVWYHSHNGSHPCSSVISLRQ